jgi:hypothetical protein
MCERRNKHSSPGSRRRCGVAFFVAILCLAVACSPSETRVTAKQRTAPLDLSPLHSTGIPAMSSSLEAAQKIEITRACADIGADMSGHLHNYFRQGRMFTILVAPLIALLAGVLCAFVYWRILAPKRVVGWLSVAACVAGAWLIGGVAALALHASTVVPALTKAVAAHRAFAMLAQEGWVPASADDSQRDFTANCSDRIADIVAGAPVGHDALKRYRTIFRAAEELPSEEADSPRYGAVIQNRARDLVDLYAVDSGLGKSQARALSWNEVTAQNSRLDAATAAQGGWWIYSSLHPAAFLIIALGIPLVAWSVVLVLSRRITAMVARSIRKVRPRSS